jgi:hypothetical protein
MYEDDPLQEEAHKSEHGLHSEGYVLLAALRAWARRAARPTWPRKRSRHHLTVLLARVDTHQGPTAHVPLGEDDPLQEEVHKSEQGPHSEGYVLLAALKAWEQVLELIWQDRVPLQATRRQVQALVLMQRALPMAATIEAETQAK